MWPRGARGHSPAFASRSTFSTPCLGFVVDPWSHVEWLKDIMAPAILMFGGGIVDCDHHVCGTGLWDRGEMASNRLRNRTFSLPRIVLSPLRVFGCDPFLQFQSRFSLGEEVTWKPAAYQPSQSAFLWSVNCEGGSQNRGFQAKALHGPSNSWMRAHSSLNHARAGGIRGVPLVCRRGAAIFGTGTRLAFSVGVSAGGSRTL